MKRPFYIIAHKTNTISGILKVIRKGANAVECDVRHIQGKLQVSHNPPDFRPIDLIEYIDEVVKVARSFSRFALVVFDCKLSDPNLATTLLNTIRNNLTNRVDLNVMISIGAFKKRNFLVPIIREGLRPKEGLSIDEDNDPNRVRKFFKKFKVKQYGYGNGTFLFGVAPKVPPAVMLAISEKALNQTFKLVYVWTLAKRKSMRGYFGFGVDAIFANHADLNNLLVVFQEEAIQRDYRLGTRMDTPFLPTKTPSYVLKIKTADKRKAGTDANLTFVLKGRKGEISKKITAKLQGLFERNDENYVTLHGTDLGEIQSLFVKRNKTGNGPTWFLDSIELQSNLPSLPKPETFVFDRWISVTGVERFLENTLYKLIVSTSANPTSGTNAKITFKIKGRTQPNTFVIVSFQTPKDNPQFGQGSTIELDFKRRDIGRIESISVLNEGTEIAANWQLQSIIAVGPNQRVNFDFSTWVNTGEEHSRNLVP